MQAGSLVHSAEGTDDATGQIVDASVLDDVHAQVQFALRDGTDGLLVCVQVSDPKARVDGFGWVRNAEGTSPSAQEGNPLGEGYGAVLISRLASEALVCVEGSSNIADERFYLITAHGFGPHSRLAMVVDGKWVSVLPLTPIAGEAETRSLLAQYAKRYGSALYEAVESHFGRDHSWSRSATSTRVGARRTFDNVIPLTQARCPRFYVDAVIPSDAGLFLIGWIAADEGDCLEVEIIAEDSRSIVTSFKGIDGQSVLVRTFRPDLKVALSEDEFGRGQRGFVFYLADAPSVSRIIAVNFERSDKPQSDIHLLESPEVVVSFLQKAWLHTGDALKRVLDRISGHAWLCDAVRTAEASTAQAPATCFAACDHALLINNRVLVLNGWIAVAHADVERVELVVGDKRADITGDMVRYIRPDHFTAYPWSRHEPLGILCVLDDPELLTCTPILEIRARGGLRQILAPVVQIMDWNGLADFIKGHTSLVGPLLRALSASEIGTEPGAQERIERLRITNFLAFHQRLPLMTERPEKLMASVDKVFPLGKHGLVIIGWQLFPAGRPCSVSVWSAERCVEISDAMVPVLRTDVTAQYRTRFPDVNDWCGFAVLVPIPTRQGDVRGLRYDFGENGEAWLKLPTSLDMMNGERLARELLSMLPGTTHGGFLMDVGRATGQSEIVETVLEEEWSVRGSGPWFMACDHALCIDGHTLLLYGWHALEDEDWNAELLSNRRSVDIRRLMEPVHRADIAADVPGSPKKHGFLGLIHAPGVMGNALWLRLTRRDGTRQTIRLVPRLVEWRGVLDALKSHTELSAHVLSFLSSRTPHDQTLAEIRAELTWLRTQLFTTRHAMLPTMNEQPPRMIAAIDRAYALGDAGMVIFGWHVHSGHGAAVVTLHGAEGDGERIEQRMRPLLRRDVIGQFRARFPSLNDRCGFVAFADMPTQVDDKRAVCFHLADDCELWLKVPMVRSGDDGVNLAKEILGMIPEPDGMLHAMFDLFEAGLGRAINAVHALRTERELHVQVVQFGPAKDTCQISVIVPLYGRFDFLRHQLAHFADDPDFRDVDLIYVVDDPAILSQTLEMASRYQPLFGITFRVAWYDRNLGFSGANNVGASLAKGEYLTLVNSDVMPQHPGWLRCLQRALDNLPEAGAVGPLLEFADGTIQHAGMEAWEDASLPGFLLNRHPRMGTFWKGGAAPLEQCMLTAACLMLRTRDFVAVGGFDEGYLIGDFEDSDLCLGLRRQGMRLWLVPEAKLWHLERQSQELGEAVERRRLLTLFNGWRYRQKIREGLLADPTRVEVGP